MVSRPKPNITSRYESFWHGISNGEITVEVCETCDLPLPFGTLICSEHAIQSISRQRIAPTGRIVTITKVDHHPHPLLNEETPYAIGVVREDRYGAMIYCRIADSSLDIGDSIAISTSIFGDEVPLIIATSLDRSQDN